MIKKIFISYEESIERLKLLRKGVCSYERVALSNSLNRVLAEDLIANEDSPLYPTASLDGFAIKFIDQKDQYIKIAQNDNPAGNDIRQTLQNKMAIKTFTGSIMPINADTLIPIENVAIIDGQIKITKSVSIGNGIRPRGELYRAGDIIIPKGTKISYVEIGVLASLNINFPKVAPKPRVAIVSTGSEILDLGEERTTFSQIRSSNNHSLEALIKNYGAESIQFGIVSDDQEKLETSFQEIINSKADFIVSTGGVSVGDYDFVSETLRKLNFEIILHGVKIKPGQHILIAKRNEQIFIALPGFSLSAIITALLYLVPLINDRLGLPFEYKKISAFLKEKYYKRSQGKTEFTPCNLELINGKLEINFSGKRVGTSALLTNMLNSPYLLYSSELDNDRESGELITVYSLN